MCGLKSTDPKHLCLDKFMITFSTEKHCLVVKNITANDMGCDYMCIFVSVSLHVLNMCMRVCVCCVELRCFCACLCIWDCVYIKCIVCVYLSVYMLLCKVCSCFYVCVCLRVCVLICLCEMVQHEGYEWRSKPACPGAVLKVTFLLQLLQNYWLYSPYCTIHPWANLITPNSLYLPLTHPHIAPHSPTHWRRQQHPTPALLPGKSHGQRSLLGYSPWGSNESDTTEWLHFHFSLSCTGDGNGNPLQYSCLENPRDGGAWRTAVYGITQSQTQLTWLSSSSSRTHPHIAPLPQW